MFCMNVRHEGSLGIWTQQRLKTHQSCKPVTLHNVVDFSDLSVSLPSKILCFKANYVLAYYWLKCYLHIWIQQNAREQSIRSTPLFLVDIDFTLLISKHNRDWRTVTSSCHAWCDSFQNILKNNSCIHICVISLSRQSCDNITKSTNQDKYLT